MARDDETTDADDAAENNGGGGDEQGLRSALASKEFLLPAVLSAAGAVAATAGPGLVRRLTESTEDKGREEAEKLGRSAAEGAKGAVKGGGVLGKAASMMSGAGGGAKKTRRLPIQRWTDVAVPVDRAYDAWLEFDRYPQFMHRVLKVEKKGDDRVHWQEKIWFSKREWEGRITDQRKNDRIAWKTTSGMSHKGVVSFHEVGDNLTRVMVTMEFEPNGMIEKMASGLRFVKRAVQADLARYKAFVELGDAEGIEYRATQDDEQDEGGRNGRSSDDDERRGRAERREERQREPAGTG